MITAIKQSRLYQRILRPCLWAPIGVYRAYGQYRRDRHFDGLVERDRARLAEQRAQFEKCYADAKEPLVSITTATYNRARLLVEQTLPSALAQTYPNIEIIIVGDHCTDETADLLARIKDPRIRFYNLPERPQYPRNPKKQWKISGYQAIALARDMARGLWIAHLDDDDVFTPDHIEKLLRCAQAGNYELVSGRSKKELRTGEWVELGSLICKRDGVCQGFASHSTIFRRTYTKIFKGDGCLQIDVAGDTYMWTRMINAGIRTGFVNDIVTLLPLRPGENERSFQFYLNQCR